MSGEDDLQPSFPLTPVKRRLIRNSVAIENEQAGDIAYQHTVLCQTCLPYRNPGDDQRRWERKQGNTHLLINAGEAINPDSNEWVQLGLPFGPKPRLVLMHLNTEAILKQSPEIEVADSMTAFVKRVLGYGPNGKEITMMKAQMARLSAATIRLGVSLSTERVFQVNTQIVTAFDLWFPKDENQRILWPSTVRLSQEYFDSLVNHAVPLDERALATLSHSAMALDIYAWLAQRLHRIDHRQSQFITWKGLKDQFGWNYKHMRKFRQVFLTALGQVHSQYRAARIEADERGMTLRNSPSPIKGRLGTVKRDLPKPVASLPKQAELFLPAPPSTSGRILLKTQTYEDAKKYARGLDVYEAEQVWHAWRKKQNMETPSNPDAAFLGWFKKYAAKHGTR